MRVAWTPLLVAAVLLASAPLSPAAGQQDVQVEEEDSAELRVLERLRALSRPLGYDSVLYAQDSIRLAEAAQGIRPGGGGAAADSVVRALLSVPGYVAYVPRKEKVWVEAQDREGRKIREHGAGLLARAMQHELDHLKGILYIDYLESMDDLIPVSKLEEEVEESGAEMPVLG